MNNLEIIDLTDGQVLICSRKLDPQQGITYLSVEAKLDSREKINDYFAQERARTQKAA